MKFEVLIAEDDDLVRVTMREALETAGYSVVAVPDGQPGSRKAVCAT